MPDIRRWNRASAARWSPRSSASATGDESMKVGVIGLGTMGMGAALNLVRKGHQVTGCDVRETARAELAAAGGTAVASAAPPSHPRRHARWNPRLPRQVF